MTYPTAPTPTHTLATLLLPSGHRAHDRDFVVRYPPPKTLDLHGLDGDPRLYYLRHTHHAGSVDRTTRALYILGGEAMPYGFTRHARPAPDEVHDQ